MKLFYQTTTFSLRLFFHLFYRLSISRSETPYSGKAILAPNHVSFLDPPLIGAAAWPEELHFLARATLFNHWGLRFLLSHLNAHPVQGTAQDIESFRLICKLLSEEKKVVIFPEGERSATGELQIIKPGIAMLAMRMECPIIPVYISGTFEAWPKQRRWPRFGSSIQCVFGHPIFPIADPAKSKKEMQEQLIQQVCQQLKEMQCWLKGP